MRHPFRISALALAATLAVAGCNRDEAAANDAAADPAATTAPAAAADPAPAASAPANAPGTDAVPLTDETSPVDAGADVSARDLAGTFAADGTTLALRDDGTYTYASKSPSANAEVTETGTWSLAANGTDLLLDPEAKGDPDRAFTLASRDELRGDGAPLTRAVD